MSLSAGLSTTITHQTEQWVAESQSDIHARLAGVRFDLSNLDSLLEDYPPTSPRSERAPHSSAFSTSSSMAPTLIHHSHDSVTYVPSLCGASCVTSTTPTETSVSTTLAPHLDSLPLLEDNNGVLEVPAQYRPQAPVFECAFWFLSCSYISASQDEWLIHVESHFRGEEPPRSVQCPLCEWCFTYPTDGWVAWNARMQHIAAGHTMLGQTLRTSRPDFDLFQYLWRKRLIDSADLKELVGGNHNLDRRLGNYTEAGRGVERSMRRRERGERRMGGGQHVGGGRMLQRA